MLINIKPDMTLFGCWICIGRGFTIIGRGFTIIDSYFSQGFTCFGGFTLIDF